MCGRSTRAQHTSYSLYEDSGVAEQYQHGVFTRTPIKATQTGDTLRVEIGPVEGSFPGMLKIAWLHASSCRPTGRLHRSP